MNEETKERPEQEPLVWPDEPKGPIRNGNRGGRRDWLVYVAVGMAVLAIGCIVGVGIWYYSGGGDAEPQAVAEDSLLSEGSARLFVGCERVRPLRRSQRGSLVIGREG